jgi:DNA-binding HxlR family transcriptional regulator
MSAMSAAPFRARSSRAGKGRYSSDTGYFNGTGAACLRAVNLMRMAEFAALPKFDPRCPSSDMPIQIGGKWTGMVVRCLQGGPRRFTELKEPLRGVTPKVLTETLRAMERDGLVTRTVHDENPPRVEYALTPLGRSLVPLIDAARAWSAEHLPALLRARETYEP